MELPDNFKKYIKIIDFYRKQGCDCLVSNGEIIKIIYDSQPVSYNYYEYGFIREDHVEYRVHSLNHTTWEKITTDNITEEQLGFLAEVREAHIITYLHKFINLPAQKVKEDK